MGGNKTSLDPFLLAMTDVATRNQLPLQHTKSLLL
jgi:hypothetical protein